jgi:hypothetical protein
LQDIEAVLKHWAATFEIPETELTNRIMAAADGKLAKPHVNVSSSVAGNLHSTTYSLARISSL